MIRRTTLLLSVILVIASISGVFGLWTYSTLPPDGVSKNVDLTLSTFTYHTPEEILPGGSGTGGGDIGGGDVGGSGGTQVDDGQDHYSMVQAIINHLKYGLNANGNQPIIHNSLKEDGAILYCEDNVQGGHLKKLFDGVSFNAGKIFFVIHRESATEYQIYTLLDKDLEKGVGTRIEVYKTLVVKTDGKWAATTSYKGTAAINRPGTKTSYGIDVHSFIAD